MKYKKEDILNALKIIQETCNENGNCTFCPFGTKYGDCNITDDIPSRWETSQGEWKAFR